MLNVFEGFAEKCVKREMLNMLDMLNVWKKIWAQNGPFSRPTFNIFNISRVLSVFRQKVFDISPSLVPLGSRN